MKIFWKVVEDNMEINEKYDKVLDILMEDTELSGTTSNDISKMIKGLQSRVLQKVLDFEMKEHLKNKEEKNRRNGFSSKNRVVKTEQGDLKISMPRDRQGTFEPIVIKKRQRVMDDFGDIVILMYSQGSSLNDIRELLKSIYKIDLSNQFLSELVDEISEDIIAWQTRKLKKLYTFMYVDCLYAPVKTDLASKKVAVYVIIGIDVKGKKEVVGIWIGDGAEAKSFWVNIFEELQRRGVEDIIHLSMDGLAGLKDGIETVFPRTITQRCIVHLVRNLYKITVKKESKEVIADYKKIYSAVTVEDADNELKKFVKKYETHKNIIKKVNENMQHIYPLFDVPLRIKKMIYTTNTIESVNSVLRKVTNGKGMFMNKNSLLKVLFLRVNKLEKKWDNGVVGWNEILNELIEIYGDRITKYIEI